MSTYKHFTDDELRCSHCGKLNPNHEFHVLMNLLSVIRVEFGESMPVTSGYRCKDHPIEAAKEKPGQHSRAAIDIKVSGAKAVRLMRVVSKFPLISGIGVNQRGSWGSRFLHFDLREEPTMWSY